MIFQHNKIKQQMFQQKSFQKAIKQFDCYQCMLIDPYLFDKWFKTYYIISICYERSTQQDYIYLSCLKSSIFQKIYHNKHSKNIMRLNYIFFFTYSQQINNRKEKMPINKSFIFGKNILWAICLCSLISQVQNVTGVPINNTNKWQAGSYVFQTSQLSEYPANTLNSSAVAITFENAMNDTNYKLSLSIQQIFHSLIQPTIQISFSTSLKTQTGFTATLTSNIYGLITSLRATYIIIVSSWGNFTFNYHNIALSKTITSTTPYTATAIVPEVPLTPTLRVISYLCGYSVGFNQTTYDFSLILDVSKTESNTVSYTIFTHSSTIDIKALRFYELTFDPQQLYTYPGNIVVGSLFANNGGDMIYTDFSAIVGDQNTIYGLSGFTLNGDTFINWNVRTTKKNSIKATSSNKFLFFQFTFLIFLNIYCQRPAIYLIQANNTCYDICPDGYLPDSNTQVCLSTSLAQSQSVNLSFIIVFSGVVGLILFGIVGYGVYFTIIKSSIRLEAAPIPNTQQNFVQQNPISLQQLKDKPTTPSASTNITSSPQLSLGDLPMIQT